MDLHPAGLFSRESRTPLARWWWSIDRQVLGALLLLLALGLMLSLAASPAVAQRVGLPPWHFVVRHAVFCMLSLIVMLGTSLLDYRQARIWALAALTLGLILMTATPFLGEEVKGARRWLTIGGFSLQPSEFVKPGFAVVVAWLLAETQQRPDMPARTMAFVLTVAVAAGLLLQPDIGQTVLVSATWGAALFLSGAPWWWMAGLIGVASLLLFAAYQMFPHFARRMDAFLDPEAGGNTYQIDRAIAAIIEGGWFGMGPGESIAARRIPDAHADYVFAAAAGEFGILFCLSLVGIIVFIVLRILRLSLRLTAPFARLGASTLALLFAMQSFIHIAVNLGLFPTKGMTLTLVSYGGTSMIAVAFGMGLALALTRREPGDINGSVLA